MAHPFAQVPGSPTFPEYGPHRRRSGPKAARGQAFLHGHSVAWLHATSRHHSVRSNLCRANEISPLPGGRCSKRVESRYPVAPYGLIVA